MHAVLPFNKKMFTVGFFLQIMVNSKLWQRVYKVGIKLPYELCSLFKSKQVDLHETIVIRS